MLTIDLNCDMGEGMPFDQQIFPYISSANIACGYHAGNEEIMRRTVQLALEYNVAIGAHPGFADKENFGRKDIFLSKRKYHDLIIQQLSLLRNITNELGAKLHHVKLHGALYNMAAVDKILAQIITEAIKEFDGNLIVYGLSGSHLIEQAKLVQLKTASEVFADRTYRDDGKLTSRTQRNAVIEDENISARQVLQMIKEKTVTSVNRNKIPIIAETICIHGDGSRAVEFAKLIRQTLDEAGIGVKAI
jgi:UPF0271 protein